MLCKEEYLAYFDAGYYKESQEGVLAFIIELNGDIVDIGIERTKILYNDSTVHLCVQISEAKALKKLLEHIDKHYKNKKFKIFGDCRDVIKNINYDSKTESHKRLGSVVDTYKHLYNKDMLKIEWISRTNNLLVDYLISFANDINKKEFSILKITKDFRTYKEVKAKVLYDLKFLKDNNNIQCYLLKNNNNEYMLSIRGSNNYSDYLILKGLQELNKVLDSMSNQCKLITFNNRKIGKDLKLVKYINEKVIFNNSNGGVF